MEGINQLVATLNRVIINPLLALIFAAGFLVFAWGLVQYIWTLNGSGKDIDTGKKHMLYGILGMFIMVSAYAIIGIIARTIGAPLP